MNVNGVSMTLKINQLWGFGELFIFLFSITGSFRKYRIAFNCLNEHAVEPEPKIADSGTGSRIIGPEATTSKMRS
jgi:hypothetical protein